MTVLTARSFDGEPLPLATVGFSPNFVPAVIAGSGPSTIFGGGAAEADAGADGDGLLVLDLALPDLSSPHPASVTSPAGTAIMRERRRTVRASYRSILVDGVRATLRREKGAVRKTYGAPRCVPESHPEPRAHIPAISFSTRSSTERNGSLHNTVR